MQQLKLNHALAAGARDIIRCLEENGHTAYMVGGCIRDTIIGRPIHDIDIATSAQPVEVDALFDHVVPTGLQHGTVTVVTDYGIYEVTTYRSEGEYVDNRRPSSVEFIGDVTEDLRRRDFTMNAMAVDGNGRLLDPFGGQADLSAGRVRTVGAAQERFSEDALRMLRAIRFASVLQMRIAKGTWRALVELREALAPVAMERVRDELWKLTSGPDPVRGWALLVRSGLLTYTKEPLLFLARPLGADWQAGLAAMGQVAGRQGGHVDGRVGAPELRMALLTLAHGANEAEAQGVCNALRLSGAQQDAILRVLRAYALLATAAETNAASVAVAEPSASARDAALRKALAQAVLAYGETAVRGALTCREAWQAAAQCQGAMAMPTSKSLEDDFERQYRHVPSDKVNQGCTLLEHAHGCLVSSDDTLLRMASEWLNAMPVRELSDLAISGRDVLAQSERPAGPWVRASLERVWLETAVGALQNERDTLMEALKEETNG